MNWDVIVAANNRSVLESCLLSSPAIRYARQVVVQWGFESASQAYNEGMAKTTADIVVFAHQDVYLPDRWHEWLAAALERLSATDAAWAVAGVIGIGREPTMVGQVYCTRAGGVVGTSLCEPVPVQSLDELLIIIKRSTGISFDARLPGFHLYGADVCLEARKRGLRSYALPAFCIHNASGWTFLPVAYWRAYFYLRRKWWGQLPVTTPCAVIQRRPTPVVTVPLRALYEYRIRRRLRLGQRVAEPARLFEHLLRSGHLNLDARAAGISSASQQQTSA